MTADKRKVRASGVVWVILTALLATTGPGCETGESLTRKRIRSAERGLLRAVYLKGTKPEKLQIEARMKFYRIPGVSLAVLDGYRTEWTKVYGSVNAEKGLPITPETIFQAGEVSRVVATVAALRLVASGRLTLDGDLDTWLKSWRLPAGFERPVTLRDLLLNTAGFNPSPLPEIAWSEDRPSLLDLLEAKIPGAEHLLLPDTEAAGETAPSGVAFAILQKIIEDVTGMLYAHVVEQEVLAPLGLTGSTFDSKIDPLNPALACCHDRSGLPVENGKLFHVSDAACGFWTNPSELASLAADLLASARDKGGRLLPAESARMMLSSQLGRKALGLFVDGQGTDVRINIRGRTTGFTCALEIYPYKGQGAVIMTNSDNGLLLTDEILRALSAVYEWPDFKPLERTLYRLDPSIYGQYVGRYEVNPDYHLDVAYEDFYLVITPTGQSPTRFYVESQTFFFSIDPFIRIQFLFGPDGTVKGLNLWQEDFKQEAKKVS